jgi:imidazole glycerol phosphate synthase subunit HisF
MQHLVAKKGTFNYITSRRIWSKKRQPVGSNEILTQAIDRAAKTIGYIIKLIQMILLPLILSTNK